MRSVRTLAADASPRRFLRRLVLVAGMNSSVIWSSRGRLVRRNLTPLHVDPCLTVCRGKTWHVTVRAFGCSGQPEKINRAKVKAETTCTHDVNPLITPVSAWLIVDPSPKKTAVLCGAEQRCRRTRWAAAVLWAVRGEPCACRCPGAGDLSYQLEITRSFRSWNCGLAPG